ncbi:MAG: hypothetical protein QM662_11410 [Gordonia sp. (in: high G+C Gram-positive bacteria)]
MFDAVIVDVERGVEGLVHEASGGVVDAGVEAIGFAESLEGVVEDVGSELELLGGVDQAVVEAVAVGLQFAESLADLLLWQRAVGRQVEQPSFFDLQLAEAFPCPGMEVLGVGLFVRQAGRQRGLYVVDERGWEPQRLVVPFDGFFDFPGRQVRQVAEACLASTTHVIGRSIRSWLSGLTSRSVMNCCVCGVR